MKGKWIPTVLRALALPSPETAAGIADPFDLRPNFASLHSRVERGNRSPAFNTRGSARMEEGWSRDYRFLPKRVLAALVRRGKFPPC